MTDRVDRTPLSQGDTAPRRGVGMVQKDRSAAFDKANRHSRRVRRLKVAVPVIALVTGALLIFFAFFNPFRGRNVAVDVGTLSVSGDRLTMELPRLTGFNKKDQSYNVTASTASQKLSAPGLIDLTNLDAVITMADKSTANLRAATGRFDSAQERLSLQEKVEVSSTKGYSAKMTTADVDFKAGTVLSTQPVDVTLSNGSVKAGSMTIVDGGDKILFENGVATRLLTKAAANAPEGLPPVETPAEAPQPPAGTTP